ncbi:hypothetical protein [Phytohabitans kaempferiae]|uniref:AMP-binding enzyme C-terminal domain-containing protein n=1 Tax=Phytohabitans kaempferiae TaxID=1620943 RepID=A0ABV6MHB9_9ACTN
MTHSSPFVERLGIRCQVDGPLAAIDGLLTWQEFETTIAAIVGGPAALAERLVIVERDAARGTTVTYGRLTEGSASLLRGALARPVDRHDA